VVSSKLSSSSSSLVLVTWLLDSPAAKTTVRRASQEGEGRSHVRHLGGVRISRVLGVAVLAKTTSLL